MKKLLAVLLAVVLICGLTACGKGEKDTKLIPPEVEQKANIGEYCYGEFDKFNSYARDNGLGDTKIYLYGTMSNVNVDSNCILATLKTEDDKEWCIAFGLANHYDYNACRVLENQEILAFLYYTGYSDKFYMPSATINKAYNVNTGEIYTIAEFMGASSFADLSLRFGELISKGMEDTEEKSTSVSDEVTKEKYDAIKVDMTYDQVNEIMGSKGERIYGEGKAEGYQWSSSNSKFPMVMATFYDGKMMQKDQVGLD